MDLPQLSALEILARRLAAGKNGATPSEPLEEWPSVCNDSRAHALFMGMGRMASGDDFLNFLDTRWINTYCSDISHVAWLAGMIKRYEAQSTDWMTEPMHKAWRDMIEGMKTQRDTFMASAAELAELLCLEAWQRTGERTEQ